MNIYSLLIIGGNVKCQIWMELDLEEEDLLLEEVLDIAEEEI